MLATPYVFGAVTLVFFAAAMLIWFSPRPRGAMSLSAGH
jgi:hypothetical protein